jgi:hypothetical protein
VRVATLEEKEQKVRFIFMKDQSDPVQDGTLAPATRNQIFAKLQEVWDPQGVLELKRVDPDKEIVCNGEQPAKPTAAQALAIMNAHLAQKPANEIWMFVWWDLNLGWAAGMANVPGRFFYTTKNADELVFAHELGHALGLDIGPGLSDYPCTPPYRMDDIMGYFGTYGGCRVHKNQGEIVNSKASN